MVSFRLPSSSPIDLASFPSFLGRLSKIECCVCQPILDEQVTVQHRETVKFPLLLSVIMSDIRYAIVKIPSVGVLHPTGISTRYDDNCSDLTLSSILNRKEYHRIIDELHHNIVLNWPCYYIAWVYFLHYPLIMLIYICFPSYCITDRYFHNFHMIL